MKNRGESQVNLLYVLCHNKECTRQNINKLNLCLVHRIFTENSQKFIDFLCLC